MSVPTEIATRFQQLLVGSREVPIRHLAWMGEDDPLTETERVGQYTSTQVQELTGVTPQTVNRLRKELLLFPVRPADARRKRDGYLYTQDDVDVLTQAQQLGMDKPLTEVVRIVRNQYEIERRVGKLIDALYDVYHHGRQQGIDKKETSYLLGELTAAILQLDDLSNNEKQVLIDAVAGRPPSYEEQEDRETVLSTRYLLSQAYQKMADNLMILVRLSTVTGFDKK